MCQEENMAMPTTGQTPPQTWLGLQHEPEREVVLQHQIPDSIAAVPARPELKMVPDLYYQKPRASLMILMCLCIPRLTRAARRVSRGKTRLFSAARRFPFLLGKMNVRWGTCSDHFNFAEQRPFNLVERYRETRTLDQ
jgi:hypothetical protein